MTPFTQSKSPLLFGMLLLTILPASLQAQTQPYATGSSTDTLLQFTQTPTGTATSQDPTLALVIGYNSETTTGTGGGWNLGATGTALLGVTLGFITVELGSSHAVTEVSGGGLNFYVDNSGISNLVGVSFTQTWAASTTISNSTSWSTGSGRYSYQFDALWNDSVLSGNVSLLSNFSLTISTSTGTLYSSSNIGDLLGITDLLSSSVNDSTVYFDYDPADGPLTITWSATTPVLNLTLLTALGEGSSTFFGVSDGSISFEGIPEPNTAILGVFGGLATLITVGQRARKLRVALS